MVHKSFRIRYIVTTWGVGVLCGLGLWLLDPLIDAVFFENTHFVSEIFTSDSKHLVLRFIAALALMGAVVHFRISRHRLRETNRILREIEQRYHILTEFSRDFIFVIDRRGIIRYVNSFGASNFGKRPEDLIGQPRASLFPPQISSRQEENIRRVLETRKAFSVEDNIVFPNGEKWINTLLAPVRDDAGDVVAVMGVSRDITDRKHTEERLRESEARFRELAESLAEGIYEADLTGRFTYANQAGFEKTGYTQQDLEKGVNALDLIASEDRERARTNIGLVTAGKPTPLTEYTAQRKDGSTYPVATHSSPIVRNGRIVGFRGFIIDLSEQRKMEEQVRFQASILEHVNTIVLATDMNNKIIYWNRFAEQCMQWTAQEIIGKDIFDICSFDESQKCMAQHSIEVALKTGFWEGEVVGWKKDGTVVPQYLTLSLVKDRRGNPAGFVGVAIDITERKRAEESIRNSESKLKTILAAMVDLVFELDRDGRFVFYHAPPGAKLILPPDRFLGRHFSDVLPPFLCQLTDEALEKNRKNQVTGYHYSLDIAGETCWFSAKMSPVFIDDQFTGVVVVVRDITESHLAEQAIRESELQYSTTIEAINDAIGVVDTDLRFVLCNAAYRLLAGSHGTGANIIGKSIFEVFPFLPPKIREEYRYVFNTGESAISEEIYSLQGRDVILEIRRIPIFSAGKVVRVVTIVRDITEQKHAEQQREKIREDLETIVRERTRELTSANEILTQEIAERKRAVEALRESETRFRSIVENTLEVIMLTQPDGIVSYLSPSCREVLGYDPEDLVATEPNIIHPDDLSRVMNVYREAMAGTSGANFEYRIITKSGQIKWISHSWKPMFRDNRLKMIISVIRDITGHKHTEEVLRQTEKLAATGRMAARIAHEINNPLAGIKNSFRLVKNAIPTDHAYYRYVGRIEKEVDRIARIVRQMFDLYRPEQEAIERFSLNECLQDVVALLGPVASDVGVSIVTDIQSAPAPLTMSEDLLRQILFNLIKNAIEASPRNGLVKITATQSDGRLVLSVSDQGQGIADELRSRIFEPFFTTKSGLKDGGLGLGLSITKGIIESLNGSIGFQSHPERGTIFNISMPLTRPGKESENE